ncbi:MAG TPA: hypothetical protein VLG50_07905 [Candidatus Saccharimonadales bacterium]|nr:hypothetical protein [Candidatus Saccharimonadales bacterium]
MDESLKNIIKIQYLYIDALELIDKSDYYLATQQLEAAVPLFDHIDTNVDSHYTLMINQLQTKMKHTLNEINSYLFDKSTIDDFSTVEKSTIVEKSTTDNDNIIFNDYIDTNSHVINNDMTIMDSFWQCLLPIQRKISSFIIQHKHKID